MRKFEVNITLHSENGCQYDIYFYYTIPIQIGEFGGTVTVSGDDGCPNGITAFDQNELERAPLIPVLDTTDIRTLSKIVWRGSNHAMTTFLNSSTTNEALCNAIRLAATEAA